MRLEKHSTTLTPKKTQT